VDRSHTNLVRSDLVDPQLVGEGVARDRQHVARDDESDHAGQGQARLQTLGLIRGDESAPEAAVERCGLVDGMLLEGGHGVAPRDAGPIP